MNEIMEALNWVALRLGWVALIIAATITFWTLGVLIALAILGPIAWWQDWRYERKVRRESKP